MKRRKLLSLLMIVMIALTVLSGCTTGSAASEKSTALKPIAKEDLKVAFIYGSAVGEEGYSYAHDKGRKAIEALGIKTTYLENIPETVQFEKSVRDLIEQGYNVIYATSYGYGTYVEKLADEYPNVYFNHATGSVTKENLSTYAGRLYQSQYLAGIAAGYRTQSNKIGYVVSFPLPEVVQQVDAFTLGVRSVKPDATVEVKWTNSWYDPVAEKAAGLELVNTGADVVIAYLDTMNAQIAAAEKGAYAIGCSSPGGSVLPDAYLTAPIFNWADYYVPDVEKIIAGTWKSESQWFDLKSGVVALDELSKNNAPGAKEAVEKAKTGILNGTLNVFAGEIKDNQGNVKVQSGAVLSDSELHALDWFVEGVIGSTK